MRFRLNTLLALLALALLATPRAWAQHGSAPNGYYPPGFNGDTFTGDVTATDPGTNQVTLVYKGKSKSDTFLAVLPPASCAPIKLKNGGGHTVVLADFHPGLHVTVYYMERTHKVDGRKVKENLIFRFTVGKLVVSCMGALDK